VTELAEKLLVDVDARRQHAVALRRWLHRHPELSFSEAETAARVVVPVHTPAPAAA
jgi:metal-dependent amidase/aminoacylase/carboxypeptidase family protein